MADPPAADALRGGRPEGPRGGELGVRIDEKAYRSANGGVVAAVRGLSFRVAAGEFVCIIGPSGCGKTTTLRILLGLDRDYVGSVDLRGAGDRGGGRARLGIVFQEPRLLPWRSVEDNVRIALPAGMTDRPLDALFDELGLAEFASRFPGELSLGLERRVALARALAVEPDLLVLDEPFVSLDDLTARKLRTLVAEAASRRAMTVLMVTHNLPEALALADRLLLLAPRPTSVIGEEVLARPKDDRPPSWMDEMRIVLASRYPMTIADR